MSTEATDQRAAAEVFRDVTKLLEEAHLDYAVGGGLSTDHWTGGARRIGDIDLVVREEQTDKILELLGSRGYETSEMDHSWLHKAFKTGVTIDLMFELKNGTRFDGRFKARRERGEMFGTVVYVMSVEDQVASLAGTADRETIGNHWYNMIDLMANNDVDWDYLILRARHIPLQMLSVLYFALAEKVPVRSGVIDELTELAAADEN